MPNVLLVNVTCVSMLQCSWIAEIPKSLICLDKLPFKAFLAALGIEYHHPFNCDESTKGLPQAAIKNNMRRRRMRRLECPCSCC